MKIIKVGKYTFIRHWWRWFTVHQTMPDGEVWLERIDFPVGSPKKLE